MIKKLPIMGLVLIFSGSVLAKQNVEASSEMMESSMVAMHEMHEMKITGDTDFDFITGMIPHHEGAVVMSEKIIPHLKDAKIREFAEKIVETQKMEIEYMKNWLKENRGQNQ